MRRSARAARSPRCTPSRGARFSAAGSGRAWLAEQTDGRAPPYFHNGSAGALADVVEYYDTQFHIGLTPQEKADLNTFVSAL
jgi:hypothetical protein